jgi:hypothetical protein
LVIGSGENPSLFSPGRPLFMAFRWFLKAAKPAIVLPATLKAGTA